MKKSVKYFTGCVSMVNYAYLVQWLMCFSTVTGGAEYVRTPFFSIALAVSLTFVLDCLLLEKGVSVSIFIMAQIVFTAITVFIFVKLLVLEPFKVGTCVFGAGVLALMSLSAAYSAMFNTEKTSMVLRFDICSVGIIIILLLSRATTIPDIQRVAVCGGVTLLLILCGIVSISAGAVGSVVHEGAPGKGRVAVAAIGIVVVLLAAAVYGFGSGALSSFSHIINDGFRAVGMVLLEVLKYLYSLFYRFMLWLSSFGPELEPVSGGMEEAPQMPHAEVDYGEAVVPAWLLAVPIAAAAAIICFVIIYFRRRRVKVHAAGILKVQTKAVRTSGMSKAFKAFLSRLKAIVSYRLDCIRYRNTAPGLYAHICRKVSKKNSKRPGESPTEFIRRIAPGEKKEEFGLLAEALQRCLYSDKHEAVDKKLCRAIRKTKYI